jgi:hypothetical protein
MLGMSNLVYAQPTDRTVLGVSFGPEASDQFILNNQAQLKRLGIQVIEIHDPVSPPLLDSLASAGFQLFVRSNLNYLTPTELRLESIQNEILKPFLDRYSGNPRVQALGIFNFSRVGEINLTTTITELLNDSSQINIYQHHTMPNAAIISILSANKNSFGDEDYIYFDQPFIVKDLGLFSESIGNETSLILMNWNWLQKAREESQLFEKALIAYAQGDSFLYISEQDQENRRIPDWPIIFLILLWFSVGIHMLIVPTYRPLIFRYFTYHRFFVDDVMRYRERSAVSGIFLLIQNAFLSGLMIYAFSITSISEIGLKAFYHHLPYLGIFGQNYFSLFALSVLLSTFLHFVGLLLIYLPSKSMNHFSQAVNLYTWLFHLNFLIVSFAVLKVITGTSTAFISMLFTSFLLVSIMSFILASLDSSKYLVRGRFSYLMLTLGSFFITSTLLLVLFLYSGYFLEVIQLSFAL